MIDAVALDSLFTFCSHKEFLASGTDHATPSTDRRAGLGMSSEMHVLFGGKLPGAAALTRAMKELGFPLAVKPGIRSLEQQKGFMPMRLRREDSGVEFDVFDHPDDVAEVAGDQADPRFTRSANFRWGGDEDEMLCALCASAALAKLVDGRVAEENSERLLTPDEAIAFARKHLDSVKPLSATERGTRPADIKRYLKPLLELRNDLVLVGRLLLIRPVRHLLRGVLFERTSDKYRFSLRHYVQPLYDGSEAFGYGRPDHPEAVWQPHFEPLLIDCLATNIFDDLGRMTTLEAFAEMVARERGHHWISWENSLATPITALVLAGEQDRAFDDAQKLEREATSESAKDWIRTHWERTTTDVAALCAKMRAREAAMVEALKLDKIWEPSPFPVEVPRAERAARSAEPAFPITPWIAPPPWLWQDLPTEPGEVRFAKDRTWRGRSSRLLVPLTREEAEARHRDRENYVLVARVGDGLLTIWLSGWDRNKPMDHPGRPDWTPLVSLDVHLSGARHVVSMDGWQRWWRETSAIGLCAVNVHQRDTGDDLWRCYIDFNENSKTIRDWRTGEMIYTESLLTAAERELAICPIPDFGEYAAMTDRLRALLRALGYGDLT